MTKIKLALLALLAALGLTATACGGGAPYGHYQTICVDPLTGLRTYDGACGPTLNPLWMWYLPYGVMAPGFGIHPLYGTATRPTHVTIVYGGVPTSGGKVNPPKTANKVTIPAPQKPAPKVNLNKPPAKVNAPRPVVRPPAPRPVVRAPVRVAGR